MSRSDEQLQNHRFTPVRPQSNCNHINSFSNLSLHPVGTDGPDGEDGVGQDPNGSGVGGEPEVETQEEFRTRVKPGPSEPSPAERDHHESTGHAVFRDWCAPCVEGRGRATPHARKDHDHDAVPVLSWDYGFLGSKNHRTDRILLQNGLAKHLSFV